MVEVVVVATAVATAVAMVVVVTVVVVAIVVGGVGGAIGGGGGGGGGSAPGPPDLFRTPDRSCDRRPWFVLLPEIGYLSLLANRLHGSRTIGGGLGSGLRSDVPAQSGTALDHRSPARLALGLERTLFMLSDVLVFGELGDGSVGFDWDVADTLTVCDLASALSIAIAAQVRVAFTNASAPLFFPLGTSVF